MPETITPSPGASSGSGGGGATELAFMATNAGSKSVASPDLYAAKGLIAELFGTDIETDPDLRLEFEVTTKAVDVNAVVTAWRVNAAGGTGQLFCDIYNHTVMTEQDAIDLYAYYVANVPGFEETYTLEQMKTMIGFPNISTSILSFQIGQMVDGVELVGGPIVMQKRIDVPGTYALSINFTVVPSDPEAVYTSLFYGAPAIFKATETSVTL